MSEITGIAATEANAIKDTRSRTAGSTVDYNSFLQLLVEQMKNQDPTKPMESTEYVAQLANFSNVEQSIQTNEKLDLLLGATTTASAGAMIGKTLYDGEGSALGTVERVGVRDQKLSVTLADGTRVSLDGAYSLSQ